MLISRFVFGPYLEAGEKIYHVFHRHPFVMLSDLLRISFFGILLPLGLYLLFPNLVLFSLLWIFITFIRILYLIFNWFHDAILITDVSLVHVTWDGFFDRASARLEYNQIDGTASEIRGFRRTIFNYGNVTVSGGSGLTLRDVINPKKAEKLIMMYQEKLTTHQHLKDAGVLKTLLTTMLRHHAKTEGVPEEE